MYITKCYKTHTEHVMYDTMYIDRCLDRCIPGRYPPATAGPPMTSPDSPEWPRETPPGPRPERVMPRAREAWPAG